MKSSTATKISNDAVSLEAGRRKGSIKKSRPGHASLIEKIREAAIAHREIEAPDKARMEKIKKSAESYRTSLEQALSREVSLVLELFQLKRQIAVLTGDKILPIRRSLHEPGNGRSEHGTTE